MPSDEVERRVERGSSATADTFITVLGAGMMDDAMTDMTRTSMIIRGNGIGATATTGISSTVRMINSIGLQWTHNMRRAQTAEERAGNEARAVSNRIVAKLKPTPE